MTEQGDGLQCVVRCQEKPLKQKAVAAAADLWIVAAWMASLHFRLQWVCRQKQTLLVNFNEIKTSPALCLGSSLFSYSSAIVYTPLDEMMLRCKHKKPTNEGQKPKCLVVEEHFNYDH